MDADLVGVHLFHAFEMKSPDGPHEGDGKSKTGAVEEMRLRRRDEPEPADDVGFGVGGRDRNGLPGHQVGIVLGPEGRIKVGIVDTAMTGAGLDRVKSDLVNRADGDIVDEPPVAPVRTDLSAAGSEGEVATDAFRTDPILSRDGAVDEHPLRSQPALVFNEPDGGLRESPLVVTAHLGKVRRVGAGDDRGIVEVPVRGKGASAGGTAQAGGPMQDAPCGLVVELDDLRGN